MAQIPNNDLCQDSNGCNDSYFTQCPHCDLFVCIKHLNEHHQKLNVSANQIRDEIGQHRSLIHEKLQFLHDQKKIYNEYFDFEIQRLIAQRTKVEEMFKILFTGNFSSSSRKFQNIVEKFKEIQQDEKNRSFDYRPDVFDC